MTFWGDLQECHGVMETQHNNVGKCHKVSYVIYICYVNMFYILYKYACALYKICIFLISVLWFEREAV